MSCRLDGDTIVSFETKSRAVCGLQLSARHPGVIAERCSASKAGTHDTANKTNIKMRSQPTTKRQGIEPIAADAKTLALEHFLPYRLVVLADSVSRALAAVYEQRFNVSIAEWRVIANLGRFGALSAGDLAAHSNLDKPKVTRALQRLLKRRLISRAIEKTDGRQSRIALTRNGQTLFRDITRLALAWEQDLLSTLSPADRKALDALLTKLQDATRVS